MDGRVRGQEPAGNMYRVEFEGSAAGGERRDETQYMHVHRWLVLHAVKQAGERKVSQDMVA